MKITAIPIKRMTTFRRNSGVLLDKLEDECNVSINLKRGEVIVEGEASDEWIASQVIQAVAHGFKPKLALKLLKDDYFFEVIKLKSFVRNDKELQRVKSRLIGSEGKAKKKLQELTEAWLNIEEHDVAILGKHEDLLLMHEGIQKIAEGKPHAAVYAYLERRIKGL